MLLTASKPYRIAAGPRTPHGGGLGGQKTSIRSLVGKYCQARGRGCPSLLGSDNIMNVSPPLAQVVGSGVGAADASAEATAG